MAEREVEMQACARLAATAIAFLLSTAVAGTGDVPGRTTPFRPEPRVHFLDTAGSVPLSAERRLGPLDAAASLHGKSFPAPRQVGVERDFAANNVAPVRSHDLAWQRLPTGGAVARLRIASEGAGALRVGLAVTQGAVGLEARFREAGKDGTVLGPLVITPEVAARELAWGPLTFGAAVDIELFAPDTLDLSRELFAIARVSHLPLDPRREKSIGSAGACERDVACYSLSAEAQHSANSTALLFVTSAGNTYGCTGVLLNTDPFSGTPYLLTDAGCVADTAEAASVNTLWDYVATACGNNTANPSYVRRTGGATIVLRDTVRHYTLLRLNDAPPGGTWFAGWRPAPVAAGSSVLAVHHPVSDLKKVSVGSIATAGSPLQVQFTTGVTEDGSVGSGIFVEERYLVGLLYGGGSSCASPSALDYYAPFSDMWGELAAYLRPSSNPPPAANFSDIWWNPGESGWGLTIADHETNLFAVWYTYRQDGTPTWFVIPGGTFTQPRRIFTGGIYETTGPRYDGPFTPGLVVPRQVGTATIDFAPPGLANGTALFTWSIGGATQTKQIERQPFGDGATDWGNDFTDIWWDPDQSGWGLTLAQHGNNVFGVWYTYETNGQPLFVVMPGVTFSAPGRFSGDLYTTTGPYYGSASFDPGQVRNTRVGDATLAFDASTLGRQDLKRGTFRTNMHSYTQTKSLRSQAFGSPSPSTAPPPAMYQLLVTMSGTGTGTVTSAPAGILCGAQCFASFRNGTGITLTATAASGSRFNSFTGTCSSPSPTCTLVMSAAASVTATFERLPPPSNLAIVIRALPAATAGTYYSQPVASATGGVPPYHYQSDSFATGAPPPGMIVTLDGNLQGTPSSSITSTTNYTFGVCVVDTAATLRCSTAAITVNPAAPALNGTMTWNVSNQCNKPDRIEFRYFDRANALQWPADPTQVYYLYFGGQGQSRLSCISGAKICIGGELADRSLYWGVGLDDTSGCTACCYYCDGGAHDYSFGCNTPSPGGGQCTGTSGGPRDCQSCNSDADCGSGSYCWTGARPAPFCGG